MTFASGSYSALATPANSFNDGGDILISRDVGFPPQTYEVFVSRATENDPWGPDVGGDALRGMDLTLHDDVDHAITSLDLPLVPPDLSDFTSNTFGLSFYNDGTFSGVVFSVTSLTVPEPSAIVLGLVALSFALAAPSRT